MNDAVHTRDFTFDALDLRDTLSSGSDALPSRTENNLLWFSPEKRSGHEEKPAHISGENAPVLFVRLHSRHCAICLKPLYAAESRMENRE